MLLGVLLGGAGCAGRESLVLDPKSPTVITMWHAYNAVAKAQFDDLVMEFNETVGMEQGIVLDAVGYGSSEELEDVLYASANHVIGSDPLPDIFASYPDNAYRLDKIAPLVSLDQYFTEEEREKYKMCIRDRGNALSWASAGGLGFRGSRKSTPYAAQMAAETATKAALVHGLKTVDVMVKGPGSGREARCV